MPADKDPENRRTSSSGYKPIIIGILSAGIAVSIAIASTIILMPEVEQDSNTNNDNNQQNITPIENVNSNNNTGSNDISERSYGPYNSEHVHAAFIIKLDGMPIDFTQDKYQLRSRFIHVENNDGTTLHRHATGVPFGDFLKSVGMDIRNGCFVTDESAEYCDVGDKTLKVFVNSIETDTDSLLDYIIRNNDRILVLYGDENQEDIEKELLDLQQITIITTGNSG